MIPKELTPPISPARFRLQLIAGTLAINLFVAFLASLILFQSKLQYQESAEASTQNLAHVLEENFSGVLEKINISMLAASDEMARQFADGGLQEAALNELLARHLHRLGEVESLRVADEHGIVRYGTGVQPGTRVDISDRQHFIQLKARDDGKMIVSAPIFGRINLRWSLPIARRLNHPDGSFAGIIYALVSLEQIKTLFSHMDVGEHGLVNLRDSEMKLVVRHPEPQYTSGSIGKSTLTPELQAMLKTGSETGTYRVVGTLDNFERTFSYRKMPGQPLYVTVGLAVDDYMAEWRSFAVKLGGLLLLFMGVTAYFAWLIYRGEKRRSEAAQVLHILNRDFITLLENTTDFIYFKDKDGRLRFCSQTMAVITGHRSWREMIGKHDFEIFPEETARIYYEEELPIFRDGTPIHNRIAPYFDKEGRCGWVSTNKWPVFDADGTTVVGIFGISRDVSEFKRAEMALRESEQRFRSMFHKHASVMLLLEPESGNVVDANAAAVRFYGYSEDELRAMSVNRINQLAEEDIRRERQLALEEKRNHFIYPHKLASGEIRTVEVYSTPIEDQGRVLLFSIVHDITEREKAEEALKRSNADLERFAYSVSHDMRQPLRAISGHLQLLKRSLQGRLDEDDSNNLNFVLDGAQRMDSMIVSLLDYSRVGRKTEAMQWIASRVVLDEAMGFLAPLIHDTQTEVRIDGVWPEVFASRDELVRLLQNLIGNAVKFRDEGQPALVEVESSGQSGKWRVSVRDHGVGIDPKQTGRLFQFFSRLQSRTRFDGTGMGLALCRRIVEHHGGRIWVESEGDGKGSNFMFELPLHVTEGERHA